MAGGASSLEGNASENLAYDSHLIRLHMTCFTVEVCPLFGEMQIAVFDMIEGKVGVASIGVVFEFGVIGGKRMKRVAMASLTTSRGHVL